ncbi:venom allergen 3, partial [Drosophila willistoni]|uniref:venom allergen 3 n=1 Tax=Drosophila willistoni TaxID=7260 RepID=UPI001F085405
NKFCVVFYIYLNYEYVFICYFKILIFNSFISTKFPVNVVNMRLLLLLMTPISIWSVAAYNYCHNASHFCNVAQMKHFMCQLDSELQPLDGSVHYKATIPDTVGFQNIILSLLNSCRSRLASGNLMTASNVTFPSASRMREIIWDNELAYMARTHAATVSFRHSECRSTQRFPMAGECVGMVVSSNDTYSVKSLLELTLLPMFDEYKDVENPVELIQAFNPLEHFDAGHFTVLASDRVSRVGCGIAVASNCERGEHVGGLCHFITCHFDFTNVAESYVYESGEPASKCSVWSSSPSLKHSNLCANTGKIFPMNHGDNVVKNQTRVLSV